MLFTALLWNVTLAAAGITTEDVPVTADSKTIAAV